jgi:hypothetical protein
MLVLELWHGCCFGVAALLQERTENLMKKNLMCLTAVYALFAAGPSLASEPLPPEDASICVQPRVPKAVTDKFGDVKFPLGGVQAPIVSCHNNKAKFKAGYHFKLFIGPGTDWPDAVCRVDYAHTITEITNACWNACIEQKKECYQKFAKKDKKLEKLCDMQMLACKDVNDYKKFPEIITSISENYCKKAAPPFPQVTPIQSQPAESSGYF